MKRPLVIIGTGLSMLASSSLQALGSSANEPARQSAASRPVAASRPASEIVLVRVGDTVITQADFNSETTGRNPEKVASRAAGTVQALIGQRLLSLYLEEHPEYVDQEEVQSKIQQALDAEGVETVEQMRAKLRERGLEHNVDGYLRTVRNMAARKNILRKADQQATDEYLEELYKKDPRAFNGTAMFVRQIRISKLPWDTPEALAAKRRKMEDIRADLISGRRSWEQCLVESDCPSKSAGGELGYVPRYLEKPPVIGKAAFGLDTGETSDVLEDRLAFYIIQVTKKIEGSLPFEQVKPKMKFWAHWQPLREIEQEMLAKHPIVGVRPPELPPLSTQPAENEKAPPIRPTPGRRLGAASRPALSRPAPAQVGGDNQ